jgi:hypothetical protein
MLLTLLTSYITFSVQSDLQIHKTSRIIVNDSAFFGCWNVQQIFFKAWGISINGLPMEPGNLWIIQIVSITYLAFTHV